MAIALAATTQTGVYPPRVALAVTGLAGESIIIFRSVGGEEFQVRDAFLPTYTGSSFVAVDAELPFGVPVTYNLYVNGGTTPTDSEGPTTYTLPGGKVAISDAVTGLSVEVVRLSQGPIERTRKTSLYQVADRNIVVSGPLGQGQHDAEYFVETLDANQQLESLLESATQGALQFRRYVSHEDLDGYFAVTSSQKSRWSQDGTDERRIWTMHLAEVDPWSFSTQHTATYTWQDVIDFYSPSGTWADLIADKATWLDVLTADWS